MKIYRRYDGRRVSHTLSRTELRKAYEEQQHIYDVGDIENGLETESEFYEEEYGLSEKPISADEIEAMARFLRNSLDNDADNCWSACVRCAIKEVLKKRG